MEISRQLRRIMRLTTLLLTVVCLNVSAKGNAQTVSFNGKNVPLTAVFSSLEQQTGLSFFFNYALLKDAKPVSLDVRNGTLEEVLNIALKGQGLDFYRIGKTVFIVKQKATEPGKAETAPPLARQIDVKGRVLNQQGEPLVSATVVVKNGKRAVMTDQKGEFELKNVPVGAVLEISYLGYTQKEVGVEENGMINVQLNLANNQLDAASVIAYGQTTQRLSTGNIASVNSADIEKHPVSNPLLAIEGQVPGLYITQSTGIPGSGVTVRIQGQNSIRNGNDPLYVVDGVPYPSQMLSTTLGGPLGASGGNTLGNPMSYINPSDIESISVLKDADATAIYGSRAANGAILITTRKGQAGATRVGLNIQQGWGQVTRMLPVLNTPQYLQMRHEALANDGLNPYPSIVTTPSDANYDIDGAWDTTRNTNWEKALIGGTANYTNFNGTISGGTANTQFLIGGTYRRQTTVFPGNFADQQGALHFNLNNTSVNQRFKVQMNASFLADDNQLPNADLSAAAQNTPPDAPPLYKADGSINWQLLPGTNANTYNNPIAVYQVTYKNLSYNLISHIDLSYRILSGLEIKAGLGYNNLRTNETMQWPLTYWAPSLAQALGSYGRYATYTNNLIESWIAEPQIDYKRFIGNGKFEALVGSTIQEENSNGSQIQGTGYNSDALLSDVNSAGSLYPLSSTQAKYIYGAVFGRINYNWRDKYILDLNARRDGSSRFGPANEYHNFGSLGVAWIFTQEQFFKDLLPSLSFGKLRGSYGYTGSDQIGDYKFLNLYTSISTPVSYQSTSGLAPTGLPNPYLQWESTKKAQGGIELGFLRDRILLTADYANNTSSNELLPVTVPIITGFTAINENLPAKVRNVEGEFTLKTVNVKTRDFSWNSIINYTILRNKLLAYYGTLPSTLVIGQPIGIVQVFNSVGVNPATGAYWFKNSHGTYTSTPSSTTDRTQIVDPAFPKFYGGFENQLQYKQFQLDISMQFVDKIGLNEFFGENVLPGTNASNQPTYVLGRWQKPGDLAAIERYNSNGSLNVQFSDEKLSTAAYTNASFIRMRNLSLSWMAPKEVLQKIHFQSLRIYVQGENLLTITSFKGSDPETGSGGNNVTPPLRMLTTGLQIGL